MSVSDGNETFTYTAQDFEDVLLAKEDGGEVEVISGSAMVSISKVCFCMLYHMSITIT